MQDAVKQGRLDREMLVSSIAQKTNLSRQDAEEIAGRVETQFNSVSGNLQAKAGQAAQSVQTGALKAADATGKAFWGVFGALFLGLVSAILGGFVGVGRHAHAGSSVTTDTTIPTPRREVYP